MSFAADARGEIAHIECTSRCCARSELCAALMASGGISYHGRGKYRLSLMASDATIVRRYFTMVKKYFDVTGELRVLKTDQPSGKTRYQLVLPDESSLPLLEELMLLDSEGLFGIREKCAAEIIENDCCAQSFLRAAFLFCGTIQSGKGISYRIFGSKCTVCTNCYGIA